MASRPKPPARLQASETASQLLRRVAQVPVWTGVGFIDRYLRSSEGNRNKTAGLMPGEIMEIIGRSGSGKTELLYEIVLNAVLPASFEGIKLGGQNLSTLVIDLDYRFCSPRLKQLTDYRLLTALRNLPRSEKQEIFDETIEKLHSLVLSRVFVATCRTPSDLYNILDSKVKPLQQAQKVAKAVTGEGGALKLVILDNLSSFFWEKRAVGAERKHFERLGFYLRRCLRTCALACVVTSAVLFKKDANDIQNSLKISRSLSRLPSIKLFIRRDHSRVFDPSLFLLNFRLTQPKVPEARATQPNHEEGGGRPTFREI
ncbi:hypothetical protein AAMO2058_001644600 [Amorphochlora amoebiformis]